MKYPALVAMILASAGCDKPAALASIHDQRQAEVDKIADSCGLPRSALRLVGDDELRMQPPADARYESVDCALAKLKRMPALKLGFVGNGYYPPDVGATK